MSSGSTRHGSNGDDHGKNYRGDPVTSPDSGDNAVIGTNHSSSGDMDSRTDAPRNEEHQDARKVIEGKKNQPENSGEVVVKKKKSTGPKHVSFGRMQEDVRMLDPEFARMNSHVAGGDSIPVVDKQDNEPAQIYRSRDIRQDPDFRPKSKQELEDEEKKRKRAERFK